MKLTQFFRSIFQNKTYSILNIFGLAIGIASAAFILLWVEDEVRYDRMFPKSNNIYVLGHADTPADQTFTYFGGSNPVAVGLADFPEVKQVVRSDQWEQFSLFSAEGTTAFKERGWYADPTIFDVFDIKLSRGDVSNALSSANSIVISEKMAQKLFGKDDPIGKIVKVNQTVDCHVSGVFGELPHNSSLKFEWLRPFDEYLIALGPDNAGWFANWLTCYVELEPTADADMTAEALTTFLVEKTNVTNSKCFLYPLSRMRLYGEFVDGKPTGKGYISTINLFVGIACIILLIACINYMNLATARSSKRALEVGVRKTFGAKRPRLVMQFIRESGIITTIALGIALLMIWLLLPMFNQLVGKELSLQLFKPSHLFGLLGISAICTFLAGSYPSLYLSAFNPMKTLAKMKYKPGGSAEYIRRGLVIFQFTIAIVLICAASVIYLQIEHIQDRPLGYNTEQVMMIEANDEIINSFQTLSNALQNTGYVASAGFGYGSILQINNSGWDFRWKGKPDNLNPVLTRMHIGTGLVETMGLTLIEGRDFSLTHQSERDRIIINRHFADLMGEAGHVGNVIEREWTWEIVGIVDNFVCNDITRTADLPVIFFYRPNEADRLYVRTKPNINMHDAISAVEATFKQFAGNFPFTYTFMDEEFGQMFQKEQLTGKLASIFSLLAIAISCLGLFGLSAFSAEQRIKEIGIRKVLGASIFNLSKMLIRNFLILVTIAIVIGVPMAWYASHRWLSQYEYRIQEHWWIFAFTGLLVILIALFTVGFQSLRAAMANPVKSIKVD